MFLIIVLITALCWIIYELLLSTISSYLLWNTILQFSLTIWFFLFGLWLGSYLSKYVKDLEKTFIKAEILLALLWWFSIILIKYIYIYLIDYVLVFQIVYLGYVLIIWALVWLEIPIMGAILNKENKNFQKTVGDIFSFDYIWSLIWTLLFPLILLPRLGLTYTAFAVATLNLAVAFIFVFYIKDWKFDKIKYFISILLSFLILIIWFIFSKAYLEDLWDHFFYMEPIIYSKQSKYQKIVLTKRWKDVRLFLDWHLQFLSLDERRYHDSLTYFWKKYINNFIGDKLEILILWWWDWLAVRNFLEYLSWKNVDFKIDLVDLDPEVIKLAKNHSVMLKLNKKSLLNPNVKVYFDDAFKKVMEFNREWKKFDIIIADFPDPRSESLSKLYSKEFYSKILQILKVNWVFTTQASNAFFTKEVLRDIWKTIESLNNWKFETLAYHTYIPSFGDWWFVSILNWESKKFYTWYNISEDWLVKFVFDKDYQVDISNLEINTLEKPIIIQYYIIGWKRYSM